MEPAGVPSQAKSAIAAASQRIGRWPWVWVAIILPILGTLVLTCWSLARTGVSQESAAWAQAAGSIIAIASAIWISDRENALRRRERRADREEAIATVRFAINGAAYESAIIYHDFKDAAPPLDEADIRGWKTQCQNALAVLRNVIRAGPLHPSFIQEATNAQLLIEELLGVLKKVGKRTNCSPGEKAAVEARINACAGNLGFLRDRFDKRFNLFRDDLLA